MTTTGFFDLLQTVKPVSCSSCRCFHGGARQGVSHEHGLQASYRTLGTTTRW